MSAWIIALIVIAVVFVVYLLMGYLFYFLMKKKSKVVDSEMMKLNDHEVADGKRILSIIDKLTKAKYSFDKEAYEEISKGVNNISSLNMNERSKYKNVIDFVSVYLYKVYKEDKKYGSNISSDDAAFLLSKRELNSDVYKSYNAAATAYNIYLQMFCTKFVLFIKREKYANAIIF